MLWLKSFHVIFMVTWFAGLFYLPRLFVYHADPDNSTSSAVFSVMQRRLFVMMTIGATLTVLFGLCLILLNPAYYMSSGWLHFKLLLVALLLAYHIWCWRLHAQLRDGTNKRSPRWFRYFNEFPSIALIAIVILAVVRPF